MIFGAGLILAGFLLCACALALSYHAGPDEFYDGDYPTGLVFLTVGFILIAIGALIVMDRFVIPVFPSGSFV